MSQVEFFFRIMITLNAKQRQGTTVSEENGKFKVQLKELEGMTTPKRI